VRGWPDTGAVLELVTSRCTWGRGVVGELLPRARPRGGVGEHVGRAAQRALPHVGAIAARAYG
jgi:hypothetical protein